MICISKHPAKSKHPAETSNHDSALEYRQWANDCADQAADPRASGDERDYLLRKCRALIALATNEDWLGGTTPTRDKH